MNKKIIGYNKDNIECVRYESAKVAEEKVGVEYGTFLYKIKKKKPINDMYYVYDVIEPASIIVKCDNCNIDFACPAWRIKKRNNIFCSKKCEGEYRIKNRELNCVCKICGKRFHVKQCRINSCKNNYCSIECHKIAKQMYMNGKYNHQYGLKGSKNPSWKSDERISYYGYKLIRMLEHPFKNIDDFVFEHRLVAEKFLLDEENSIEINGRLYLSPDYVVHHIDFNRLNNSVDNLLIMKRSEHIILHWRLKMEQSLREYCETNNINYTNLRKYITDK